MNNNLNGRKIASVLRKAGFSKRETSSGMIISTTSKNGYDLTNMDGYYTLSYRTCNRNADTKPQVKKMKEALEAAGYGCRYGRDLEDWIYIESYNG